MFEMMSDAYSNIVGGLPLDYTPTRGKFRPLKRHAPPKDIKGATKRRRKAAKAGRRKNRR